MCQHNYRHHCSKPLGFFCERGEFLNVNVVILNWFLNFVIQKVKTKQKEVFFPVSWFSI